jgi:light-regulated signal transduction histidine kinase (bacteriophytochrome)
LVDYRGQTVFAATRYIEETEWGLVVKIDKAEAFAPVSELNNLLMLIMLSSSTAVVLASLYVSQSVTRPITNLTRVASQIAEGELSRRVEVTSRDETGTLARTFNHMARNVEERTAELERSNADLEHFAHVASHDLQEPLRMVMSYLQLLEKRYKGKLDSDADEFIAFAVDGAGRMRELIQGLLAYSRVSTQGEEFESVACGEVLDQATANLEETVRESGAVLTQDPLPTVAADRTQLIQLFQNLIGNAIKFHGEEPPRIHVSAENTGAEWRFSVRDNGIGFDPQDADRIFLIYQRLHAREEYPGTGIGLAICKKIVERHGGRIWVSSKLGEGSIFHFTLPTTPKAHEGSP